MDIRTPIGLMFLVKGLILAGYGASTGGSAIYQKSFNFNVNFYWGVALVVFGAMMLGLARMARDSQATSSGSSPAPSLPSGH